MAYGPGKYTALCRQALIASKGVGVILVVLGGEDGCGFEVQAQEGVVLDLPALLREMATSIEKDNREIKNS